jgi:type VI secretion system secreted protein Hcp
MSQEEANRIVRVVHRARRSRRAALTLALPTVAALGAGAAIAIGSIPSGDGTITGCYITSPTGPRYGALRVIDPSVANPVGAGPSQTNSCLSDEQTVTWNQSGPQGPQGPQGPAGGQGAIGAPGAPLLGQTTFGFGGGGRTFLKLDGIKGESTDKDHKGEIELSSFSIGVSGAQHASGSGGGAGKVSFQSFTITKQLDKASAALFKAAAKGTHFKEATIAFARKAGKGQMDYLEYKLDQVLISSIQDGTSQKAAPIEQVTFAFQKANETFIGTNGKPIQSISVNVNAKF